MRIPGSEISGQMKDPIEPKTTSLNEGELIMFTHYELQEHGVDEDCLFEEEEQEEGDEPVDGEQQDKNVYFEQSNRRIRDLYNDYKTGDLNPQPGFQRGFVWDKGRASKLVESVLLGVPIPPIYTAEEDDCREVVIDGQQRLTTFFGFRDGTLPGYKTPFQLQKLEILRHLNCRLYKDLEERDRNAFDQYSFRS